MPAFERVCPECGASNSLGQAYCAKCRTPLLQQTEPPPPPQSSLSRRGMAVLAWRVTKFLARTGFDLARAGAQRGYAHVQERKHTDVKNELIEGEYQVSEWRTWSKPADSDTSKQSEPLRWGPKK